MLVLAAAGTAWWIVDQQPFRSEQQSEGGPVDKQQPLELQLEAIRQQMKADPSGNLAQFDALIGEQPIPEAARRLAPELLALAFTEALQKQAWPEAERRYRRLVEEYPGSAPEEQVTQRWGETLANRFENALETTQPSEAEALYRQYIRGQFFRPAEGSDHQTNTGDDSVLEAYSTWQAERWRELPESERWSEAGREALALALETWLDAEKTDQRFTDLVGTTAAPSVGQWLEVGNIFLEEQRFLVAMNTYLLAHNALLEGAPWHADAEPVDQAKRQDRLAAIESRIADLGIYLIQQPRQEILSSLQPDQQIAMLGHSLMIPAQQQRVQKLALSFAVIEFLELTEPLLGVPHDRVATHRLPDDQLEALHEQLRQARKAAEAIRRGRAIRLLELELQREENELNPEQFSELLQLIESELETEPGAETLTARRQAMHRVIQKRPDLNPIPLPPEFERRYERILSLESLRDLSHEPEASIRQLREVIRASEQVDLLAEIRIALQAALTQAQENGDLEALITLAGLYASEFRPTLEADPFAKTFLAQLQEAAQQFNEGAPKKGLFVQALIASAFPSTPAGEAAREQTIQKAFAMTDSIPITPTQVDPMPSGLQGWSSESIENATAHHLLLVYDGPERFAFLCDPLRKGTLPLVNGNYRVVVMTPLGAIEPYRAERNLINQHVSSQFFINAPGEPSVQEGVAGDYSLLREPDSRKDFTIDPETGMVAR